MVGILVYVVYLRPFLSTSSTPFESEEMEQSLTGKRGAKQQHELRESCKGTQRTAPRVLISDPRPSNLYFANPYTKNSYCKLGTCISKMRKTYPEDYIVKFEPW